MKQFCENFVKMSSVQLDSELKKNCVSRYFDKGLIFLSIWEDSWSSHSQTESSVFCPSCRLADYDVVVTTYSLVSKEIPVQKEEAEKPSKDADDVVRNMYLTLQETISVVRNCQHLSTGCAVKERFLNPDCVNSFAKSLKVADAYLYKKPPAQQV